MEQWLRDNFTIFLYEGAEMVKDEPETSASLSWIVDTFGYTGASPTRAALAALEAVTGWGDIFDDWQARGLIN